jgi:hypothetical protein
MDRKWHPTDRDPKGIKVDIIHRLLVIDMDVFNVVLVYGCQDAVYFISGIGALTHAKAGQGHGTRASRRYRLMPCSHVFYGEKRVDHIKCSSSAAEQDLITYLIYSDTTAEVGLT